MKKIIITIDGHAGCGKSSTAKEIAKILGYKYINSGLMYRAITFYIINNKIDLNFEKKNDFLEKINLDFEYDQKNGQSFMFLNGKNIMSELYKINIEKKVGLISSFKNIREKIVKLQQKIGIDGGIVIDGRDTGTKVFPKAELKIFMTAHIDNRSQRRLNEIKSIGQNIDLEDLKKTIKKRDLLDETRKISPLTKAKDAIKIDNTNLTLEETVNHILNLAQQKIVGK